jgi:hypothetical protein
MAATKYTYSISTDFSSGENSDSLTEEILTSSISSAALTPGTRPLSMGSSLRTRA